MNPEEIRPALEAAIARAHRQPDDLRAVRMVVEQAKRRGDRAVMVLRGDPRHTAFVAAGWHHSVRAEFRPRDTFAIDLVPYRRRDGVDLSEVCKVFIRHSRRIPRRTPRTFVERVALFRRIVQDRKILVVLANADQAAQVRPFVAGAPDSTVIATSTGTLGGLVTEGAEFIDLTGDHATFVNANGEPRDAQEELTRD